MKNALEKKVTLFVLLRIYSQSSIHFAIKQKSLFLDKDSYGYDRDLWFLPLESREKSVWRPCN